jgi:hypothetical protein
MTGATEPDVAGLVDRLTRLESNIEALQDQVHRQNERHQQELADLRRQLKPEELARTMSADARRRGI